MCSPQWGSQDGSLEASSNQLTSKSVFWQQTRLNLVNICKATARVDRFPWMGVGWGTWLLLILSWLLQASSIKSSQLISEPELWWHTICCGRDDTQSCKINCSCSAGFGQTNQGGNASNGFWICNSRDSKSALNPSSLMSEDVSSWPRGEMRGSMLKQNTKWELELELVKDTAQKRESENCCLFNCWPVADEEPWAQKASKQQHFKI